MAEVQIVGAPPDLDYATPSIRLAVTRLLAHEAGGDGASAADLAAAAGRLFERLWERLAQVVGHAGVEALFLRAVHLCKREFSFFHERIVSVEGGGRNGEGLHACLREQRAEVIKEASVTLFATFAGLLVTFIGDGLAWQLLRDAWPEAHRSDTEGAEE